MRAATRHDAPSDQEGVFESFSDMVLCTVIVLITLVVVLALNVMDRINVYIEPNHFSGGASRPWLYLQAQDADYSKTTSDRLAMERAAYGGHPFVMLNLFSPSSAQSATTVKDGLTVASRKGESFRGQCDLTAYGFLQLAAGIEPGSFPVNGERTTLMLPKFSHKEIMLDATADGGYTVRPNNELALKTMALAWPVFNHPIHARRPANDYLDARVKIYVETLESADGAHRVMIGHSVFTLPRDVENGRLGWLAGFSSGLTEMVYLGESRTDPAARTNTRIEFFETNGFDAAAEAYRAFSYPGELTADQQQLYLRLRAINPDLPNDQLESYVRAADAQRRVSAAIVNGSDIGGLAPPLLRYRHAWKAYVEHRLENNEEVKPPKWLMTEFLEPLGFDQAVARGLREDV